VHSALNTVYALICVLRLLLISLKQNVYSPSNVALMYNTLSSYSVHVLISCDIFDSERSSKLLSNNVQSKYKCSGVTISFCSLQNSCSKNGIQGAWLLRSAGTSVTFFGFELQNLNVFIFVRFLELDLMLSFLLGVTRGVSFWIC